MQYCIYVIADLSCDCDLIPVCGSCLISVRLYKNFTVCSEDLKLLQ
jgi:hypothetical protein